MSTYPSPRGVRDTFMDAARWSSQYEAATLTTVEVAGKKVMNVQLSVGNHCGIILTGKSGSDGRILMRARQSTGTTARTFGIALRVGGDANNSNMYILRLQGTNVNISRVSAAGTLTSNTTSSTIGNTPGQWYWFDAKIDGGRMMLQVWPDGEKRPEGWRIVGNMGTYPTGGFGFYFSTAVDQFQVSHFASTFK